MFIVEEYGAFNQDGNFAFSLPRLNINRQPFKMSLRQHCYIKCQNLFFKNHLHNAKLISTEKKNKTLDISLKMSSLETDLTDCALWRPSE